MGFSQTDLGAKSDGVIVIFRTCGRHGGETRIASANKFQRSPRLLCSDEAGGGGPAWRTASSRIHQGEAAYL